MDSWTSLPVRRAGYALIGIAGLLSTLSTFSLLSYLLFCRLRARNETPLTLGVRRFSRSSMGKYLTALMVFDLVQGLAFSIDLRWAHTGSVLPDGWCFVQGFVSQAGDLGIAVWSLVITLHTFCLLFLERKPPRWVATTILGVGTSFVLFMPVLGTFALTKKRDGSFWGPTGAWCWVSDNYQDQRVPFFYLWGFLFLSLSMITYPLIYLKFTGVLDYQPRVGFSFHGFGDKRAPRHVAMDDSEMSEECPVNKHVVKIAKRLMWYPIAYCVVVIPVSVCRIGSLAGFEPPFWLFVVAGICFSSSGVADSILFLFTRQSFIQTALERHQSGVRVTTQSITTVNERDSVFARSGLLGHKHAASILSSVSTSSTGSGKPLPPVPKSEEEKSMVAPFSTWYTVV